MSESNLVTSRKYRSNVLGYVLVAVLVVGTIALLTKVLGDAYQTRQITALSSSVSEGIKRTQSLYQGNGGYDPGPLYMSVKKGHGYPGGWTPKDATLSFQHELGGQVTFTGSADGNNATMQIAGLPSEACIILATRNFVLSSQTVNGQPMSAPATVAAATTACAENATVSLTFN